MRRAVVTILLPLACVALPACANDEDKAAREQLIDAIEKANESTVRGRVRMVADTAEEGSFELAASVTGTGDGSRGRMRARYVIRGQTVRMIMHRDEMWMRVPALDPQLPRGKLWIRTTDPEFAGSATLTPDVFGEMLRAAGEVEDVGAERVRGVSARHLRATLDVDELARAADESPRAEGFRRLLARSDAAVMLSVWIPEDERPLRYHVRVRLPRPGGGRQQTVLCDVVVEEYDVDVDATPPPESLVTDDSVLD